MLLQSFFGNPLLTDSYAVAIEGRLVILRGRKELRLVRGVIERDKDRPFPQEPGLSQVYADALAG